MRNIVIGAGAVATLAGVSPVFGADWIEPRDNDAGAFVSFAQYPFFASPNEQLTAIQGVLESAAPRGGSNEDPQDFFAIHIPVPSAFSAQGVNFGSLDYQLFLFDANGLGLLANDNQATFTTLPRILPMADDGTFTLTTPGTYFLGVAGRNNVPVSGAVQPIFNYGIPTELSGPDGPGGLLPHNEWVGTPGFGGYRIELEGAFFVPTPGAGVALVLAGAMAGIRRRR